MSKGKPEAARVSPERQHSRSTRKSVRPTIGLSTALLGVTTIAIAMGNWQIDKKINHLERQMPGLRAAARELVVDDPNMFAVVKRNSQWFGESIFDVYLPQQSDGQSWRLCMALDNVDDKNLPQPLTRLPLSAGHRVIEVRYDKEKEESVASLLIDGVKAFEEVRPKDWEPRKGSSGGGFFSSNTKCDTSRPLVLYRKRFLHAVSPRRSSVPKTPNEGVLVWIEKWKDE